MGRIRQILFSSALLTISLLSCPTAASDDWSYDNHHGNGPESWKNKFPKCEGGHQSPINIETSKTQFSSAIGKFTFNDYERVNSNMVNNGHTVQLNVASDASISGGGLDGKYKLAQLHFHWGSDSSKGAEHTVDNKHHPLEIHLVHYSDKYSTVGEAADKPKGLAVLGIFTEISSEINPGFDSILKHIEKVKHKDGKTDVDSFALSLLVPSNKEYFRYNGSLTTPSCYESVIWTIYKTPIPIAESQISEFRKLFHNEEGEKETALVNNYRPLQKLGDRTVFSSDVISVSNQLQGTTTLILGVVLMSSKFIL